MSMFTPENAVYLKSNYCTCEGHIDVEKSREESMMVFAKVGARERESGPVMTTGCWYFVAMIAIFWVAVLLIVM